MIFFDSNIIIDLFRPDDAASAEWSRALYRRVVAEDQMVCNLVVLAEVVGNVDRMEPLLDLFARFAIGLTELSPEAAFLGGVAFRDYRRRGGRKTMLPDFLIGGHASALGATLATRDRRLATYFPDLSLITPETHPHG